MNKTEFINAVAEKSGLSKVDAKKAVEAFVETVSSELKEGGKVALLGFGSFSVPEKSPVHVLLEEGVTNGSLQDWQLTIEQSIPMAASVATEDTLKFTEFHSMGATYAVYLKAVNQKNQTTKEGWVSCGSFLFPYKAIRLDSLTSIVMPEREPQRFVSEVKIYTQEGTITGGTIEVNRPMEIEGWKIYQLSYDETKGRWSDISVFELVRDPWLPVVYTRIIMMMAGAICLFVSAQKRKEEDKA